jgi:hypothetical protein
MSAVAYHRITLRLSIFLCVRKGLLFRSQRKSNMIINKFNMLFEEFTKKIFKYQKHYWTQPELIRLMAATTKS